MSPITPEQHLQSISEWWDKNNAREFLTWKLKIQESWDWRFFLEIGWNKLDLWVVKEKHLPYLQKVIETLIIEKSVCEARMHLAANCKAEVAKKWITPLYNGPDIEFNPSSWKMNQGIVRYETLSSIYNTNNVRPIADSIVNFVNSFPENYIPLSIIEGQTQELASYSRSKKK